MNQLQSDRRRFHFWIPAILAATLISLFSTHYFSSQQTGRVIIPVLHWLFPAATPRTLHLVHVGIRKMAHVTEFGLFSITVFHGIRGRRAGWRLSWALATLVIAVTYAGLDEWHQSFVPLRRPGCRTLVLTPSAPDWLRLLSCSMRNGDRTLSRRPNVRRTLRSNRSWSDLN